MRRVNGQAITYDASGNPLSYGGWSFGWQNGRQLKTASKTSDGKTETLEYSYDADGIRTSKTYTVETFTQLPDYTVTFQADGTTVKTMTVEDGYTLKDSDYPAVPAKSGYTGEWVKYTSAVHSNVTVQAKYTAVVTKYTVFFKADGFTVKAIQVNDGYVLQDADYPEVPAKVGCNGAWEKHTAAIHSNVTINAVYSPIASHYTVTFKANGKTLKTMTVADGYVLKTSDYPTIPKRAGYTGSWPKTGAIHANTTITAVYTKDSGIVIPTQPTSPGEIMSGGEGEPVENAPIEADAPAEDETVAPQGMHVTGTQTVTHEYLTLNGKVARETIKTNDSLTAVLDGPMVKRRPPVYILPCSGSGSWMHIGMRSQPRIKIRSSREPAKDETFIFSRSSSLAAPSFPRTITPCNKRKIDTECIFDRCIRCLYFHNNKGNCATDS